MIASEVGELVAVDFFGPLPRSSGGATYVFVVLDVFFKFLKLYALRRATAVASIHKISTDFLKIIKPAVLLSDHGPQFTSNTWINALQALNITPTFISIRHPASNPVERVMKELGRILRTYCHS